jgi:hypothetical protein
VTAGLIDAAGGDAMAALLMVMMRAPFGLLRRARAAL